VVRDVKAYPSRWMHQTPSSRSFAWQDGYAAFTVGVKGVAQVRAQIANQEQHHHDVTFEDEFQSFREQHGIEYDSRYLWR
jgi:putative transposase